MAPTKTRNDLNSYLSGTKTATPPLRWRAPKRGRHLSRLPRKGVPGAARGSLSRVYRRYPEQQPPPTAATPKAPLIMRRGTDNARHPHFRRTPDPANL